MSHDFGLRSGSVVLITPFTAVPEAAGSGPFIASKPAPIPRALYTCIEALSVIQDSLNTQATTDHQQSLTTRACERYNIWQRINKTCVKFSLRMLGRLLVPAGGRARPGLARPKNVPVGVRLLPTCLVRSAGSCPPSADADCHKFLVRFVNDSAPVQALLFGRECLDVAACFSAVSMDACS